MKYSPQITLGNVITVLVLVISVAMSIAKTSGDVETLRSEHVMFERKDTTQIWRDGLTRSIDEIKADLREIKRAVK